MNRFGTLVGAIACKVSHNVASCDPPRARQLLGVTLDDFVGRAVHQTVFFLCSL